MLQRWQADDECENIKEAKPDTLHIPSGAPSTTFKAYRKAQEALQKSEEMTFSDGEIDAFLPKELKRN